MNLTKKPKNVTLIEGFPGFGLVGTITTEFLIEHLGCELIGSHYFEEVPATVAIHDGGILHPMGVYYCKKYNLCIIHSLAATSGIEWKAADIVNEVAKTLSVKEMISIEGIGSNTADKKTQVYYHSNKKEINKKLDKIGLKPLKEGIVIGVTASILMKRTGPLVCLFSETHSQLPDSKAAAKVIEALDQYLGLKVDYSPLLKQAEQFEEKLKGIMQKGMEAEELTQKKQLSYMG